MGTIGRKPPMTDEMILMLVIPSYGAFCITISHSKMPKEKTSTALVYCSPDNLGQKIVIRNTMMQKLK